MWSEPSYRIDFSGVAGVQLGGSGGIVYRLNKLFYQIKPSSKMNQRSTIKQGLFAETRPCPAHSMHDTS